MVIVVETTPIEQLAKPCRKALKEAGLKICIFERALKKILTKSDLSREDKCNQNKCKVCKLNSNANYKGRGAVY